ncbi:hypothetical protein KCP73_05580 [Salmonella enterica subsp. enterica]|nr:hypothetical protein KCP73_05580 [Salmonella enterica subsp. enterica]
MRWHCILNASKVRKGILRDTIFASRLSFVAAREASRSKTKFATTSAFPVLCCYRIM